MSGPGIFAGEGDTYDIKFQKSGNIEFMKVTVDEVVVFDWDSGTNESGTLTLTYGQEVVVVTSDDDHSTTFGTIRVNGDNTGKLYDTYSSEFSFTVGHVTNYGVIDTVKGDKDDNVAPSIEIEPESTMFSGSIEVTLSTDDNTATIYYQLNDGSFMEYDGPFDVTEQQL